MRAVVQRVSQAKVTVDGKVTAELTESGLLVLLGVTHDDTEHQAATLARKIWELRILPGERSASDVGSPVLVVSQFTLYADTRKGRRPSWKAAAPANVSEPLYDVFCMALRSLGAHVETGVFGDHMDVASVNDGPVTIWMET